MELAYSKEPKIKDLLDGIPIMALLNYLYVLLSVKKDNQLNQMEESVLNGVIISSFRNWTINEIKHAFRLAIDGTLDLDMYQKLDAITFGKVMKKYNTFKREKIKNFKFIGMTKEENIVTEAEKEAIQAQFHANCILPYLEDRKTMIKPRIDWATFSIFQHFWKKGTIVISEDEKKEYKARASTQWKLDVKARRNRGERVSLEEIMSHRTHQMYSSCLALFDKTKDYNHEKK